jgi:hypothetical protein
MAGGQYPPTTEAQTIHSAHPLRSPVVDTMLVASQLQQQASQLTPNLNPHDKTSFNRSDIGTLFDLALYHVFLLCF